MTDHFNTAEGWPQSRVEVVQLSDEDLNEFMGMCPVEPADFVDCLACWAYWVMQTRGAGGKQQTAAADTVELDSALVDDIAKLIAGLQVPISLGLPLGRGGEAWRVIWDKLGFGWRGDAEIREQLLKVGR